jgi:amino acid adenylation domain-containing protein/non-ribosomal peptide synthase protein (TIGR01720 family)
MAGTDLPADLKAKFGDRLAALSPAQRALLTRAMEQKEKAAAAAPPQVGRRIGRRKQANFCPLSIDQERLWFVQQLDPDSPIYNIYSASRFRVPVDVPVLGRALDFMVQRYEILRTTFPSIDGRPVQQIAPEFKAGMPWIDLRALSLERRRSEADRVANQIVGLALSLVRLPLFRMAMVQVADEDFIWPVTMHHIITDWISFYSFLEAIQKTYLAFLEGKPSPVPEPALQYADYTVYQRERLLTKEFEDQIAYWRELLKDASDLVALPIDRPRPPIQSAVGGRQRVRVAKGPTERLRALAQKEGTTPFVVLLAAVKLLLARLSGEVKILVGTPMSHRIEPETQEILGFFLSQLIYCSDYAGNPTFREMVRRERDASIAAYAHSEVPFSKLVEALRPQRDLSRTPFFQIQLLLLNPQQVIDNGNAPPPVEGDSSSDGYWVDAKRTQSELAPIFWEEDGGLDGFFEYNRAIFDPTTIDRMKEQFRVLLVAAVANPEARLWDLPMLPESQRHQLLVEWNDVAEPLARGDGSGALLHGAFFEHAARQPAVPALLMEGEADLSYGDLARRARRLAHRLRQCGVGPEVPVIAAVDRSPAAFVAFLGVLAAGGVYVPVEPGTPADRAAFMLRDTGAPVVLSSRSLGWSLGGAREILMGEEERWPEAPAADALGDGMAPALSPQSLAYVIYTSGSTGEPKGVGVPHGPAAVHCRVAAGEYAAKPGDRFLQFSIFAFDAIIEQTLGSLSGGATLVSRGDEIWDPADLGERLAKLGIAVADLPTSYWGRWAQSLPPAPPVASPVRLITPAGEAMSVGQVRHWQASAYRAIPLLNGYGPTEAVVTSTAYPVPVPYDEVGIAGMVPIGRPLPGRRAYVVDAFLNPVPSGVAGELVLGGALLARGYLNRPELTAGSFVPDPFAGSGAAPGARMYRSGDRVRTLADGVIEFLGRIDFQVKVRGFRIELGEIESALTAHPAVREAAVLARAAEGGSRLAAYVVAEAGQTPTAVELREALRERLPEYMVPSTFTVLPELPYLPNSKVDRRALAARPEAAEESAESAFAAPRTPAEKTLAAIWREVLRREQVGIHDNFFALGGDSILSIQVIARAQRAGLALAPRLIFQHQTIAELAEIAASGTVVAAEQGPVTGPVPPTPIQRWFLDAEPVDPHHFNLTVLFETAERLAPRTLAAALLAIETHHDALRLRFHRDAQGGWIEENAPSAAAAEAWPLAVIDLAALPEAATAAQIERVCDLAQGSLDLAAGPLHRALSIDLGAARPGRFFWTVHHLVVDGVSWRLLLEDLATAYAGLERVGSPELPPKTTSFRQWATRLAEHAGSAGVTAEVAYWQVLPWGRVTSLARDLPGGEGANRAASEHSVTFSLEPEETRELLEDAHRPYNTRINDLLLAGLARSLSAWTESPYVLLDLEGHGREEIFPDVDLSRTVGWFTSLYPVLLDLAASPDPGSAIKAVKEQLRNIPGNGLGFGLLRHPPTGAPRLAGLPRAEISFNYLGQLDAALPESTPFRGADESFGAQTSPRARRAYLLDWTGGVFAGRLQMTCAYSADIHRQETVERLADGFRDQLREILVHCRDPQAGGFTPSDFSAARLSQKGLEKLLGKIGQAAPGKK